MNTSFSLASSFAHGSVLAAHFSARNRHARFEKASKTPNNERAPQQRRNLETTLSEPVLSERILNYPVANPLRTPLWSDGPICDIFFQRSGKCALFTPLENPFFPAHFCASQGRHLFSPCNLRLPHFGSMVPIRGGSTPFNKYEFFSAEPFCFSCRPSCKVSRPCCPPCRQALAILNF